MSNSRKAKDTITPGAETRRYVRRRSYRGSTGTGYYHLLYQYRKRLQTTRKGRAGRPSFSVIAFMDKYDVVYILKQYAQPDELRYSLRSICENMEFNRVWFYCGKPQGIKPDVHVSKPQTGASKWERARSSLIDICKNDEITKSFWLFNDDFYLLKPFDRTEPFHVGELSEHIARVEAKHKGMSAYTFQLRECERQLKRDRLTTLDYAIHVPLLVERSTMLEALTVFPNCPMFRSLYGNYANIGGTKRKDVKISDPNKAVDPEADLLSSSDKSFHGEVGRFLAERFPTPCRYEV